MLNIDGPRCLPPPSILPFILHPSYILTESFGSLPVCVCVWQAEVQQRQWRRVENECHSFEPCISCMQLSRCRPLLHAHGKWQEKWAVGQLDRWGVSGQVNYNLHCLSVLKPPSTSYGRVKGFSNIQLSPHFGQRIA